MSRRPTKVDFTKCRHILPLRERTDELLQVLLAEFTLKKNPSTAGVRLTLKVMDGMPSIADIDGKRELHQIRQKTGTQPRDKLAKALAAFYRNPRKRPCRFKCADHPLRYANGGVLPVVRLDGRDYFWLFYRDIFPIGWNIANGASDNTDEMLDPNRIVLREFGEEAIAVDWKKRHTYAHRPEDETVPLGFQKGALDAWSRKLKRKLNRFPRLPLPLTWVDGPDSVDVTVGDRTRSTDGYFLNITPEDNAIELDRIAFINLGKGVALLDGEHRNGKLLNEVIGLFEVEKMRDLSRKEFLPDVVFFDGREQKLKKKDPAGRRKELAGVIGRYLKSPTLERSDDERRAYAAAKVTYDLCPITRAIVHRFFLWERMEKAEHRIESRRFQLPKGRFDIFVSFRDPDLPIAQGLAEHMERRGFKVFMSVKTLQQLGAADYFRVINEALEQSAVLIVVGTRPDRFTSGWVSYEWQSFLAEIHSGRKSYGRVFPFAGGMRVDELPFALRQVQMIPYDPASPERSFDKVAERVGLRSQLRKRRGDGFRGHAAPSEMF
jgi:hypothetical protein